MVAKYESISTFRGKYLLTDQVPKNIESGVPVYQRIDGKASSLKMDFLLGLILPFKTSRKSLAMKQALWSQRPRTRE